MQKIGNRGSSIIEITIIMPTIILIVFLLIRLLVYVLDEAMLINSIDLWIYESAMGGKTENMNNQLYKIKNQGILSTIEVKDYHNNSDEIIVSISNSIEIYLLTDSYKTQTFLKYNVNTNNISEKLRRRQLIE